MTIGEPAIDGCPKRMTYGPCGGVDDDGGCEVDARPCPFVDVVVPPPPGATKRPRPYPLGPILIDLRIPADDHELDEIAGLFGSVGGAALIGEHVDDPVEAAPHRHAERLAAAGVPSLVTVTGRDRSRNEHAAEIDRLVTTGVGAVHCVTGDHPSVRLGPEATATFTMDGTELAALARATGALVSVCESPSAHPIERRADRLVTKQIAGADMAVLNHCGSPTAAIQFADRCRSSGVDLALVAPVPVITDHASAHALAQFPGLVLPDGLVERILTADDPHASGVDAAIEIGEELLASGRFAAINLSGSATTGGPVARARTMIEVAHGATS